MEDNEHSIEHHEATNLLEYIQLAFHLDIGGDHLENFEKSSELTVSFPLVAIQFYFVPILIESTEENTSSLSRLDSDWHSPTEHFWNETSFRGPPTA